MSQDVFDEFKSRLLSIDPVSFAEKYLTLDGEPFRLHGNGYKPFADIYRYIGVKAIQKDAKPVILVKGRQVGATTMASVLESYFMASGLFGGGGGRPPMRLIHCFPNLIHVFTYSKTKLSNMLATSMMIPDPNKAGKMKSYMMSKLDPASPANDSQQFKQFVGGNFMRIESTGLSADRLRGGTVDCLIYDEIQDITKEAISNANKVLSQSKYGPPGDGIQVYFGTPKQRGTEYFKMWQASSQQYYHLGCEKCQEFFPLYTPGSNEWEKIWIYGFIVKCPHCGHEQNKNEAAERGKWIATKPDDESRFVGYHINQFYMPNFSREKIDSEKPENHPINTERAYQNEVLGEFYSGVGFLLTPDEIQAKCGDPDRKMKARIHPSDKVRVFSGFDWGDKIDQEGDKSGKGKSYSCCVVLAENSPGILDIEFATILKNNNLDYKKQTVDEMFRRYSVHLGVGDIGYANDLSEILQREHGDKFLVSRASGNVRNHIKYDAEVFPKTIHFERDYHIAEVIDLLKRGIIRFPYKDFERISWLITHCCSMEIKTSTDRWGEISTRYVKGATPNDGFMALVNAYLAYKYTISEGFSTSKTSILDKNKNNKILATVGFVPRMH